MAWGTRNLTPFQGWELLQWSVIWRGYMPHWTGSQHTGSDSYELCGCYQLNEACKLLNITFHNCWMPWWSYVLVLSVVCWFCGTGVGVLDGLLYAVGGHDGPLVRKSVEVFNPDNNCWSPVADMNLCRRNAGETPHHYHYHYLYTFVSISSTLPATITVSTLCITVITIITLVSTNTTVITNIIHVLRIQ